MKYQQITVNHMLMHMYQFKKSKHKKEKQNHHHNELRRSQSYVTTYMHIIKILMNEIGICVIT